MDLGGTWAAAPADGALRREFARPELDDADWERVLVPGETPAFASPSGPVLYRRRFESHLVGEDRRAWVVMEGVLSQSDVWLDGSYLGDAEGYFSAHAFEVTAAMRERPDHLLAVEVTPGGIWAPVELTTTGPVRVAKLRAACTETSASRAALEFTAVLDSSEAVSVELETNVGREGRTDAHATRRLHLAAGANRARWKVEVPAPELWWPAGLGACPLYDVSVRVLAGGEESDSRTLRTGLRQVRMRAMVWELNGEKIFLMGADVAQAWYSDDVERAREAGLNFLRVKGHVGRPEFYDAADEAGLLLWQDLWQDRWQDVPARRSASHPSEAVWLLAHRPSVVVWCASGPTGGPAGSAVRSRRVRRAVERLDGSRPALARPVPSIYGRLLRSVSSRQGHESPATRLGHLAAIWPATVRFAVEVEEPAVRPAVEALRRLRLHPSGGFVVAERETLDAACAPLLAVSSWPATSYRAGASAAFTFHVVNEFPTDAPDLVLKARLVWPGGGKAWRLAGSAPALSCTFAGSVAADLPRHLPGPSPWPLRLELALSRGGEVVSESSYESKVLPGG